MPAVEWFYESGGQRQGPVSPAALKQLAIKGRITPSTLIWKEGLPQWTQAKVIRGLFTAESTSSPAPAPLDPPPSPSLALPAQPVLTVSRDLGHPLDMVISGLRYAIPQEATAKISRLAGLVGVYCLYPAILDRDSWIAVLPVKNGGFRKALP